MELFYFDDNFRYYPLWVLAFSMGNIILHTAGLHSAHPGHLTDVLFGDHYSTEGRQEGPRTALVDG